MNLNRQNTNDDYFEGLSSGKGIKIKQRKEKLNNLIDNGFLIEDEIFTLKFLTFTDTDIINMHLEIKPLLSLINRNIINKRALRKVVESNKQNMESIKSELKGIIEIDLLGIEQKVLVMNILDIGI